MAKSLKDVLAGVKSSKVEKLDHKDMYQWNSPDGLKFIDDKHPVEKHADRVGNGDDVYTGSTKPAKYPKQKNDVYEETDENIINQKLGAGEKKTAYIEERRYLQRAAERVAGTKQRANKKLEDIARYDRKRKESMERQQKEVDREREEERRHRENEKRKREEQNRSKRKPMHENIHCNMTESGKECDVHGMKECPGYKLDSKGRSLLMDKKTNEAIEIGKALRVGNQFSDSHLARNKRNPSSLGKPANLLDRANKTIGKLKGSTFMVKKMTEENIDEIAPPGLENWIKSNKERFVKEYGKEKGMQVLYAKAWKMHGKTESGLTSATNTDYAGPGAAGWTTGRLDVGTLE